MASSKQLVLGDEPQEQSIRTTDAELKQQISDQLERTYWKRMGKKIIKDWRLYVMLIPMICVFLFWRYMPLTQLIAAFKEHNTAIIDPWQRDFVGFEYFTRMLFGQNSPGFWQAFRNTFTLSFYGLMFGFPIPIIIALFFNEIRVNIVRTGMQVITYLPRFVSLVAITSIVTLLFRSRSPYNEAGVLTQFFEYVGLITAQEASIGVMRLSQFFRPIFVVSGIWEQAGYGSIVFFAAIISISPTSYEAASIDGASKMAQIRYVVLPGISSTIIIMLILRIGELLVIGYEKVLLLYNNSIYDTADIVSTYVYRLAGLESGGSGTQSNASLATAADLIAAVLSMVLVIGSNFVSRRVSEVSLY